MSNRDHHRPFYFFHDARVLRLQLALASVALTLTWMTALVVPSLSPSELGLCSVVLMPVLTYVHIAHHALRGTLQPQSWRSARLKTRHQWSEFFHYAGRVVVAQCAGQFMASWFGSGADVSARVLPMLVYVAQSRAFHDMHVVMHIRGQMFPPEQSTFTSRDRTALPRFP